MVLKLIVAVFLFCGEGFLLARSSFAFVTNEFLSSNSIAMTTIAMSTTSNHQEAAINNNGNPQRKTASTCVPLIDIGITGPNTNNENGNPSPPNETSLALIRALQDSGFALIRSPLLTRELQSKALVAAKCFLATKPKESENKSKNEATPLVDVIEHPMDPKVYSMLDSDAQFDFVAPDCTLKEYVRVLRLIKMDVLRLVAIGLGMSDAGFFAKLHDEDNDTLRLITYHKTLSEDTGNRCKEHSDYGTITLLSTDGGYGLELFHEGRWLPVPFVEGVLVVNVGSLLSRWTKGILRATLHRVAGPASLNSCSDMEVLKEAVRSPRTSVAFFADPNKDVSESLEATAKKQNETTIDFLAGAPGKMSIGEYIKWRSGGDGAKRSGVSFMSEESKIIHKT